MSEDDPGLDKTADAGTGLRGPVQMKPGTELGKYRLERMLGQGGMGVVWAARDPDLERLVAIKVLRYEHASPQLRQRLLREARAMAKLKHPNVLTVYEAGTVGDRDYIAMELVDGMTLDAWLALRPPPEDVWQAVLAAGRGLAAAHEAGVVHRDFKPHNVLRSREGRVLVTDFGLARGMLTEHESAAVEAPLVDAHVTPYDDTMPAAPQGTTPFEPQRANDSLLDSPLTQTGALIGTPAYMAPEQYRGAPPDPRTDQFAFCVTAWQAVTGERPFKGTSLEELRKAASAGVTGIEAKLPRAVRGVLARGLDPHAERRWPTMNELLDELERAGKQPARRRALLVASVGAAVLAAGVIGFGVMSRRPPPEPDRCDAPAAELAEAWSPTVRSAISSKAPPQAFARIAATLDRYAQRWVDSYTRACQARPARSFPARVGCLEGVRDHVSALTYMLRDADPRVFEAIDLHGMLPAIAACEIERPYVPPPIPREGPRRSKALEVLAATIALRGEPDERLAQTIDRLVGVARTLDTPTLVASVRVAGGNEQLRRGDTSAARALFAAAKAAERDTPVELRDRRLEAMTMLGMFEASLVELAEPNAPLPPSTSDPNSKATLHPELAKAIVAVRNATTTDPALGAHAALLTARAYEGAAQWGRYRHAYKDALGFVTDARKLFEAVGDTHRAARTLAAEARVYLQRGDERALDDAVFAARRADDMLEAAQLPALPELDLIRAEVAFMRRELAEYHRFVDRHAQPPELDNLPLVTGRVVPATSGAIVVAWQGDLVGDPRRVYSDARGLRGTVATVAPDGTFAIRAQAGWAIIAESKTGRSTPQLITMGAPTLALKSTTTLSGTVGGLNLLGVRAFARFTAGSSRWFMEVPVLRDGVFDLRGLPPGAAVFGLRREVGLAERVVLAGTSHKELTWPHGQTIELIVRGKSLGDGAYGWLFRGKLDKLPVSRADIDAAAAKAANVASGPLVPVGADNIDASRDSYRAGDRHVVITGNPEDNYTACVSPAAAAAVTCKTVAVTVSVAIDYPDGRFAAGASAVVFEL